MNILVDGYPRYIDIDGKSYGINTSYRVGLKIILAFEDNELSYLEKNLLLVKLLYKEEPKNFAHAIEKGIQYLDCRTKNISNQSGNHEDRRYSFSYDEKFIFSAVDKVLNGKLSRGDDVHWWEFVMAFMELPEDSLMSKIIYYRTQFAKGKLTKEEKQIYFQNKDIFELPDNLNQDEQNKINEFLQLLHS